MAPSPDSNAIIITIIINNNNILLHVVYGTLIALSFKSDDIYEPNAIIFIIVITVTLSYYLVLHNDAAIQRCAAAETTRRENTRFEMCALMETEREKEKKHVLRCVARVYMYNKQHLSVACAYAVRM